MPGDSPQARDLYSSREPLPPARTVRAPSHTSDATRSGAPLPPYRPGLYDGGWSDTSTGVTAWGAPLQASTAKHHEAEPALAAESELDVLEPVAGEGSSWETASDAPWASTEPDTDEQRGTETLPLDAGIPSEGIEDQPAGELVLDDQEVVAEAEEPVVGERFTHPAAADLAAGLVAEPEGAALEIETGPDRSWWGEDIAQPMSAEEAEPPTGVSETSDAPLAPSFESLPEREPAAEEPLGASAVESDVGLWADATPLEDVGGPEPGEFPWEIEPDSTQAEPLELTDDLILEPAAEEASAAAEVTETYTPEAASSASSGVETGPGPEAIGEKLHVVAPAPLDPWLYPYPTEEVSASWEAFGKALEEAASWGELGASIATGQPAGAATEPAIGSAGVEAAREASTAAEESLLDLARRLETIARRLREEGDSAVQHILAEGDRLDASLAGFIAGIRAARRD